MTQYVIRRLLVLLPVFLGITLVNFFLVDLLPGDAVDAMIDPRVLDQWTPEMLEARREALGLNESWPVRYLLWLKELGQGNLGYSYHSHQPVLAEIAERLGPTLKLQAVAFVSAVVLGVGLGVYAALRQYSPFDYVFTVLTYVNISIPSFFYALLVVYIFAVQLRWFPSSGLRTFGVEASWLDEAWHLVLPALCLALGSWASLMRYCRASMLEVMRQDYLTAARAKGVPERTVILRHALRNALLPMITVIGLSVPSLISGAVLIESVFGWPGMGYLSVQSVFRRDYPVVMGIAVLFSSLVLLSNLLADLGYALADPRIRYD